MREKQKTAKKEKRAERPVISFGERLTKMFELPSDTLGNRPKVTAIGRGEVMIENFKGIMDFADGVIRINTNNGVIKITGSAITIKEITVEEIIIGGKISNIDYDA